MPRRLSWVTAAVVLAVAAAAASGQTQWRVRAGITEVLFHTDTLDRAGLAADSADRDAGDASIDQLTLSISVESDLLITTRDGALTGFHSGAIAHTSGLALSGAHTRVAWEVLRMEARGQGAAQVLAAPATTHASSALMLNDAKIAFDAANRQLLIECASVALSPELADALGRPEWAGKAIASMHITADLESAGGDPAKWANTAASVRGGTECDRLGGPDVIVGDLIDIRNYSSVGGIEAFAVGTTSCNVGDDDLIWVAHTNQHPVIGQNMYRLKDGRFEHIGLSWLKHGFNALTQNACGCGCSGVGGSVLGVGCSDPYEAILNGDQNRLGPRFQVNPYTGEFSYPYFSQGQTGNDIYKRLQVKISDLDPAQDGGGVYFVEGQYVTPDDAAAGHQANNASHRPVTITGGGSAWSAALAGTTVREQPAIRAWKAADPEVDEADVSVPDDGAIIIAAKATAQGGGVWRYEYAVQNLYSHRAVGSFTVPVGIGATVSNIGFHDVDYHSGEPFDGTDWPGNFDGQRVTWATDDFDANTNANALRWGTLYNFRFDADQPPVSAEVTLGLFRPGTPASVQAAITGPDAGILCATSAGDGDGDCRVDLRDYARLQQCFGGTGNPYNPACACFDADTDLDIDAADASLLGGAWTGPAVLLTGCEAR